MNMSRQNSFSFSNMSLPSIHTSVSSSFDPSDLLAVFPALMLLKAYVILSLDIFFFVIFVGLRCSMTCALIGFECSSIFLFWMPLPGLTNMFIPCSPVQKKKVKS